MIQTIYLIHAILVVVILIGGYASYVLADSVEKRKMMEAIADLKSAFSIYSNGIAGIIILIMIAIPFFVESLFIVGWINSRKNDS